MKFNFQRKYLAAPYIIFLVGFIALPLVVVFYYAFTDVAGNLSLDAANSFFSNPQRIGILTNSIWYAFLNTMLCLLIGYPIAMILANKKYNKNAVIVLLFVMPMWINFVIRTWATKDLLFWLGVTANANPNYPLAVTIGLVYNFLPFVILPLYTTMLKMDKSQIEAAQDLGATPFQTFYKVIIPMTMPGIVAAATMVFMPTISSQVIPTILSEKKVILFGEAIYNAYFRSSTPDAVNIGSFMSLIMLVFIALTLFITRKFNKREEQARKHLW
ncbi:MAG: ABC transporter permease [Bacilli bacterium]|jgi:spermidine/putrescine transport system permease protein